MPDTEPAPADRKSRLVRSLLPGLVLVLALVAVAGHLGEGREFLAVARRAQPAWLLVALVAQAGTYAAQAGVWRAVLARAGARVSWRELYPLSIVALFTNQAIPTAGLAGSFTVVRALQGKAVPRAVAVGAVLVDLIGVYAAYGLSVALALAVLRAEHHLGWAVLATAAVFALLGFGVAGGATWIAGHDRPFPRCLARVRPVSRALTSLSAADPRLVKDRGLVTRAFLLRSANFALDILTLWTCLRAVGEPASPGAALAAFVLGSLARTLGVVPGGLGTFEAATVGGLALFGTHVEPALTATLLFRGLSFWLPMIPGFWLGPRLTRAPRREAS